MAKTVKAAPSNPKPKTAAKPAAKKAAPPKSKPEPPPPEPPPVTPSAAEIASMMSPQQRDALETLSANLARAAVTAQGAIAEAALRQADQPAALSVDPFHVAPAMTEVLGALAAQPDRLMRAQAELFSGYMELWRTAAAKVADGEILPPVVEPAKGDKRFSDPEWSTNPVFDVMKQSYLLSSNWLTKLLG